MRSLISELALGGLWPMPQKTCFESADTPADASRQRTNTGAPSLRMEAPRTPVQATAQTWESTSWSAKARAAARPPRSSFAASPSGGASSGPMRGALALLLLAGCGFRTPWQEQRTYADTLRPAE